MGRRSRLGRRLSRMADRLRHKFSRARLQPSTESLEASANGAPTFRALPVDDLLERISELEATYLLNIKLWGYPQLRKARYWDRRKIWVVIDQLGQAEEALSYHMREAEAAFRALSARPPPKPRSLFHEASLQLPVLDAKTKERPAAIASEGISSSESSSLIIDPAALPRASASKFLTSYYLSLSEIRDSLKRWRAELKAIADHV
ncbi:hypothetical protein CC85DRAFT_284760 [Cutaneotrichosporon oleaginosum]|uniref:Uncharacterized protein n=1 Tax=Cutaneotrichosporon oleaginosum TaxID=879819 RepID=A0A0J0XQ26_9TREE|nr:uncharacterized protein CC85DRAFT_284760 [Cutaneotrichosporon oleaginosum]KLT43203.1 hypothetical protein CC85DRAFT_284760 [Cutaneotrichosporon oleaginosum]TXT09885.1 hypothetical protein COLE_03819 [Cutaneotrichosporon oleaginosum]